MKLNHFKSMSKLRVLFYLVVLIICLVSSYHSINVYIECEGEVLRGMFKLVCVEGS